MTSKSGIDKIRNSSQTCRPAYLPDYKETRAELIAPSNAGGIGDMAYGLCDKKTMTEDLAGAWIYYMRIVKAIET
jgi:hypothetical protein